jgi:hypothetical protein
MMPPHNQTTARRIAIVLPSTVIIPLLSARVSITIGLPEL